MPATTPQGWPYVLPADHPLEYPAASQTLANKLQTVVGALKAGVHSGSTDANGVMIVPHGMGKVPTAVVVSLATGTTVTIAQFGKYRITAMDATNFSVTWTRSDTGAALPNNSFTIQWIAL